MGIRPGQHVAFVDPAETVDRGAIELDAFLKRRLEFDGRDSERFHLPQDVAEPKPDQANPSLFDRLQHVLLSIHTHMMLPTRVGGHLRP